MHEKLRQHVQAALDAGFYAHVWTTKELKWYKPGDTAPAAEYNSCYFCDEARYHVLTQDLEAVSQSR